MTAPISLFCVVPPGLEAPAMAEVRALGFDPQHTAPGGIEVAGTWEDAYRLNRDSRTLTRVLARIAAFRAPHLAQLDKRARKVDWSMIPKGTAVSVEATCRKSRIYHDRAAAQRIRTAMVDATGATPSDKAMVKIKARIEDDLCTISLDTTGAALHLRGHKQAVGKAPLRETMAAALLRMCAFDGTGPVVDPMCGSGTFPLEAAEIAAGLTPGRSRDFALARLAVDLPSDPIVTVAPAGPVQFYGFDRDQGAVANATKNAEAAGVADLCAFARAPLSELQPPEGPPGLVMVNPPYGARIGDRKQLFALYGTLGAVMRERFAGWRFGMITSDPGLAKATGLKLDASGPIAHGSLKIALYEAGL